MNYLQSQYRSSIIMTFLLLFFSTITSAMTQGNGLIYKIIVVNNQPFKRVTEVINISRKAFAQVPMDLFPVVHKNKRNYACQLIDDDQDGKWDHILVEISMDANSKDTIWVKWLTKEQCPFNEKLTNVRFSLKTKTGILEPEITFLQRQRGFVQNIANPVYQMEGPGIENDKVAFRVFFDSRNGKDIYGKLKQQPILEEVGIKGSWHTLQNWGMDIFKTGNSLGAGALAVEDKQHKAIFRLADADTTTFNALYEGGLRASFKLEFKNWDVGQKKLDGSETLSITKGDYFYENKIMIPLKPDQLLISGIANFKNYPNTYKKHNNKYSSISTYGLQADGTDSRLGVAIMFQTSMYAGNKIVGDNDNVIPNTSYVELKSSFVKEQSICFFACWEKSDERFATRDGFEKYLQQVADRLANPIEIKVIKHN